MIMFFLLITFTVLKLCAYGDQDIQYSRKIVSDTVDDHFAYSLATSSKRLIISAPYGDNGNYVLVEPGVKLHAPQGDLFGLHLDMNEHFLVASGRRPHSVYVFSSALVARIPVDGPVKDVKVLDDNTIIIVTYDHLLVYNFDHHSSWERHQRIVLDGKPRVWSLAVSNDFLAVGYYDNDGGGRVNICKNINNRYTFAATLRPPQHVLYFGVSLALFSQHLVVSSQAVSNQILFTYKFDSSTKRWKYIGKVVVPGSDDFSYVSLHNGILAATSTDRKNNPEVCGHVYKLSTENKKNRSTSTTNNNVSSEVDFKWKKLATLKTKGAPLMIGQFHRTISVRDGVVYTGRVAFLNSRHGHVFVHNINKLSRD